MPGKKSAVATGVALLSALLVFCGMGVMEHREELGTLKEQSVEEAAKSKISAEQQAAFDKIRSAVLSDQLKTGLTSKEVVKRYGKPCSSDTNDGRERWLYRSFKGKLLEKPWVFLYFNESGKLEKWESGHLKEATP